MEVLELTLRTLNEKNNKIAKKNIKSITCEPIFTKWIDCIYRKDNNVKKNYVCNEELTEFLECIDKNSKK